MLPAKDVGRVKEEGVGTGRGDDNKSLGNAEMHQAVLPRPDGSQSTQQKRSSQCGAAMGLSRPGTHGQANSKHPT